MIEPATEDFLYGEKVFFDKTQEMLEKRFEELWKKIKPEVPELIEGSTEENIKTFFFDWVYNCDEILSFEEYLYKFSS